ncbi:MAG: replication initiation factor domain-containing protein [Fimbriimonadaceae bacterium]|nr:replication initiation factor domain-containing protein [Fimbriimonadaceae bacterium]
MVGSEGKGNEPGQARLHWLNGYFHGTESEVNEITHRTVQWIAHHRDWVDGSIKGYEDVSGLMPGEIGRASRVHSLDRAVFILRDSPQTCRLIIKGEGCDALAVRHGFSLYDEKEWCKSVAHLMSLNWVLTRIDVAIDDLSGLLDIRVLDAYSWEEGQRNRHRSKRRGGSLLHQQDADGTLLFGVKQGGVALSDLGIRIYDRNAKQKKLGQNIRVELQARGKHARRIADILLTEGFRGIRSEVLRCVNFREVVDSRKSKPDSWPTCSWWLGFLNNASRGILVSQPRIAPKYLKSLEHSYGKWLYVLLSTQEGIQQLAGIIQRSEQRIQPGGQHETEMYKHRREFSVNQNGQAFDADSVVASLAHLVGPWLYLLHQAESEGSGAIGSLVNESRKIAEKHGLKLSKDNDGNLMINTHFIEDRSTVTISSKMQNKASQIAIQAGKIVPESEEPFEKSNNER